MEIIVKTNHKQEFIDITDKITESIKIENGI